MKNPREGDRYQTHSYKHNGHIHRIWQESTVLKASQYIMIGANERTLVIEADGRTWITREPAIGYFHYQKWFNIIGMLRDDGIYYYCNISSPFVYDEGTIKYIDYDLDVKVFPDMSYAILDEDEYAVHKELMNYPDELDKILHKNLEILIEWIETRKGPFAPGFVEGWYKKFMNIKKRRKSTEY
ncbi:MAG: hypothetical protein K0R71_999 [Bacillales bacterium]|jgi:protein associated with RNAse G/E|nr:hypothetical protein [Bacillales bacterium]